MGQHRCNVPWSVFNTSYRSHTPTSLCLSLAFVIQQARNLHTTCAKFGEWHHRGVELRCALAVRAKRRKKEEKPKTARHDPANGPWAGISSSCCLLLLFLFLRRAYFHPQGPCPFWYVSDPPRYSSKVVLIRSHVLFFFFFFFCLARVPGYVCVDR